MPISAGQMAQLRVTLAASDAKRPAAGQGSIAIGTLPDKTAMSPRKSQLPDIGRETATSATKPGLNALPPRLMTYNRRQLVGLLERLAGESEDVAARIAYLSDPRAIDQSLQQRIGVLRDSSRFIAHGAVRRAAAEIARIAADIRADVLPRDPSKAATFAMQLFCLDLGIFERSDDSDNRIADELRAACVLWLEAAAAVRAAHPDSGTNWTAVLYQFYRFNDYGVRHPLLEQAHRLLHEHELRALAASLEEAARRTVEAQKTGNAERYQVFRVCAALGLVARALRDAKLYERSILIYTPRPSDLQANDIAELYLACGDGAGALRWLNVSRKTDTHCEHLDLLDRAYELLGATDRQIEIRRELYRRAPDIRSYRALNVLLSVADRPALHAQACQDARANPNVAAAAEFLFALEEPGLAERLIVERLAGLDGSNDDALITLVKTATANGRPLAAALVWRTLISGILSRRNAKAYLLAARHLLQLRALSATIEDYCEHPHHESYERTLREVHGRKASFWGQLESKSRPD